jgi:erythromycin esterase-like protein
MARSLLHLLAAAILLGGFAPAPQPAVSGAAAAAGERLAALPLTDTKPLLSSIGSARFVALGESTHGTHEFYRERARISQQLIREHGFGAVVIEADWPDTERVNRYVRGLGADRNARQALGGYTRFPRWMWRNAEFAEFIEWLRTHNLSRPAAARVGVYGMDVYNLADAAAATTRYLDRADAAMAARVRAHYRCFAPYRGDTQRYGRAARRRSCQAAAKAGLAEVRRLPRPTDAIAAEAYFSAVRSAASVAGAEEYFRTAYGGTNSWNLRDRQMATTIAEVADHVGAVSGRPGKVIAWAHNSHVGDARATDAPNRGELNLGQLLRERHGKAAFLVGFLTHGGTVVAADEWGGRGRVRNLRPALPQSHAELLRQAGMREGLLLFPGSAAADRRLAQPRLQRAVGVIYRPEAELRSHYFMATLSRQFDALVYLERTRALTPLD